MAPGFSKTQWPGDFQKPSEVQESWLCGWLTGLDLIATSCVLQLSKFSIIRSPAWAFCLKNVLKPSNDPNELPELPLVEVLTRGRHKRGTIDSKRVGSLH